MKYQKQIHTYIQEHKSEIIHTLMELIEIPSVRGEASEHAPFGESCAEVLRYTENLYNKNGFETVLDEDGGYLLSYFGNGKKSLGLFAHADVVPVEDDWTLTKPFDPIEKDGFIIGRGALDDKSAIVLSLYCAKIIRDLKLPFASKLIMFTGSNEESGMGDMKNYLKKHTPPDFSIVPDSAFPLYRGNKGRILLKAEKSSSLGAIKRFYGGKHGTNVANAVAVLRYSDAIYDWLKTKESKYINICKKDCEIVISAEGVGKHTALPEGSVNAAAMIAELLSKCEYLDENTRKTAAFIEDICSDYYGGCVGIDNNDSDFGRLTFVNYQINSDEKSAELYFNIRHGLAIGQADIKRRLNEEFAEKGFTVTVLDEELPHIVPKDNPMLRVIMEVYRQYTGDTEGAMQVNAGGTYGQLLPCAAEIGPSLQGGNPSFPLPVAHGRVHQPDEYISAEGLLNAIEITVLMLLACDATKDTLDLSDKI